MLAAAHTSSAISGVVTVTNRRAHVISEECDMRHKLSGRQSEPTARLGVLAADPPGGVHHISIELVDHVGESTLSVLEGRKRPRSSRLATSHWPLQA